MLTRDVEQPMRGWLTEDRRRQAARPFYGLEDFGWPRERLAPYFEEYMASYPQAATA